MMDLAAAKRCFSVGKKHTQLYEQQKKFRKLQLDFFLENSSITSEDSGKDETTKIEQELEKLNVFDKKYFDMDKLKEIETSLTTLEHKLITLKINFYVLLKKNQCCIHNLQMK